MCENKTFVQLYTKTLAEVFQGNFNNNEENDKREIESKNLKPPTLTIPNYQRAYEWSSYHVKNLLDDTYACREKSSYRMGTIILYKKGEDFEIIDGQQRLITLTILLNSFDFADNLPLLESKFNNIKSFFYIKNTKKEVESFLNGKQKDQKEAYLKFLIEKLTFSILIISGKNALDQAYTFFDSLNSKGKGLTDFELLQYFVKNNVK